MVEKNLKFLYQIMAKLKRLCLAILIWRLEKIIQKLELRFVLGINVLQLKIKQVQDTGLAKCGKER